MNAELETERWRGKVDTTLDILKATLETISTKQDTTAAHLTTLDLKVQATAIRMAIYAALAAFVSGGIMSVIVGLLIHKLK